MAELRVKGTGTLKLFESDNTSSVTIASPASLGGDRTITLPDASVTLASGTMLATDGSGASLTSLNATQLGSGTVPDARFPATLPAASGVNLTSLDAANLGSNTVPTARLGSGTASSTTVLYGDQTYKAEPSGAKIGQVLQTTTATYTNMSSTTYSNPMSQAITPVATDSKILVMASANHGRGAGTHYVQAKIWRYTVAAGTEDALPIGDIICNSGESGFNEAGRSTVGIILDSPSTTAEVTYQYVFRASTTESVYINNYAAGGQNTSTITCMEILA